ncbi:hypothetical protein GQ874_08645 [Campylobacter coli]|nr:hypothetical protein [Campylobacter coli]EDO8033118.1 hypothetical protein [Campylobacter coli]EEA6122589.1 hypothetical protein [Campylobacter coli]EEA6369363.1 hypothetical protein [Campylobacter coli]EFB6113266.1 hypothetical protein [Campylobacter coli]
MIGTDLHNAKDENGIFYVRELYQRALDKGGFVTFHFTNVGGKIKIHHRKIKIHFLV